MRYGNCELSCRRSVKDFQISNPTDRGTTAVECQSVWFSWTSLYSGVERAEVRHVRKGQSETMMCREQAQGHSEGVQGEDGVRDVAREEFLGNVVRVRPGFTPWIPDSETAEP